MKTFNISRISDLLELADTDTTGAREHVIRCSRDYRNIAEKEQDRDVILEHNGGDEDAAPSLLKMKRKKLQLGDPSVTMLNVELKDPTQTGQVSVGKAAKVLLMALNGPQRESIEITLNALVGGKHGTCETWHKVFGSAPIPTDSEGYWFSVPSRVYSV